MSKLVNLLGFVAGVIFLLFIIKGGTELISKIFDVEDHGTKLAIRWSLIIFILILGALLRRKSPSI